MKLLNVKVFVSLVLISMPLTFLAESKDESRGQKEKNKTKTGSLVKSIKSGKSVQPIEKRDPFRVSKNQGGVDGSSGDMLSADSDLIPSGIRVKGILRIKGKDPVAIINVPGSSDPYYVRENEVVRIEVGGKKKVVSSETATKLSSNNNNGSLPQFLRNNPQANSQARTGIVQSGRVVKATATKQPHVFYLFISKINKLTVEAYPKTRPDDKQIFR